jgi:ABC-type uncharacterized transport system involved in gliding motility auxiliary subunit
MNAVKRAAPWLALGFLVAAAGVALFAPWLERLRWGLLIAGAVLLVVSLATSVDELRGLLGRRTARYGLGTALVVLLALGVVVLASAVSLRHSARWDLTESRRQSLAPQTIKLLQDLRAPVEAIAFFRFDTPGKQKAEDLLKLYAAYSGGKFTWRMEDPDRAPGLARRYGVESYGTVVLERGAKSEKVLDAEEERLTNGLVKVSRDAKSVVYALKGHGEADIASAERGGFSEAKAQLERANYEVKDLTLAREAKVPDDAAVLLVAGPKADPFPQELEAIDAYLKRGGSVFFMLTPFQANGLRAYLARYGFAVDDDLVVEVNPIARQFGFGPEVPVVTQYENHPITRDLGGLMTLFPLTRSLGAEPKPPRGVSVQPLALTSSQSWGETDRAALEKGEAKPDPQDKKGPLPVAVAATLDLRAETPDAASRPAEAGKSPAAGAAGEARTPARARVVVVGTANLATNQFLGAPGNRDFFLNTVSWLAEQEDQLSVRPKEPTRQPIILTSAQAQIVFWLPVVILPLAIMLAGIGVVIQRRRAR